MSIKDFCVMEMGNMGALERKVDVLLRYCTAQSESERRHCYADLKKIRNAQAVEEGYRQSIDRVLRELGIGDHLKGYAYLQTAIALALYSPQMVYNVMTVLYPAVAAEHKTSVGSVERSMRSAIESGWDRWIRIEGNRPIRFLLPEWPSTSEMSCKTQPTVLYCKKFFPGGL